MATEQYGPPSQSKKWLVLLQPKWLCWHAFAVLATAGMFWLGDWQLHRAEAGNELSWAYTIEWPAFGVLGLLFWARSLRDELRPAKESRPIPAADDPNPDAQAYVDRLKAEVRGHGRWHGFR